MQIVCDELLVVVGCQSRDKLDDCSSNEVLSMLLVAQDLLADIVIPFLHELEIEANYQYFPDSEKCLCALTMFPLVKSSLYPSRLPCIASPVAILNPF